MADIKDRLRSTEPVPLRDTPELYRTGYRDGYRDGYGKGYEKGFNDGAKGSKKKFVMTALDDNNSDLVNPKPSKEKED
jgi:flagellar biosynthesis/type III secretory pathway protein FliH